MVKIFHPTLYNGCNYLSMLGLKLNHINKKGHKILSSFAKAGNILEIFVLQLTKEILNLFLGHELNVISCIQISYQNTIIFPVDLPCLFNRFERGSCTEIVQKYCLICVKRWSFDICIFLGELLLYERVEIWNIHVLRFSFLDIFLLTGIWKQSSEASTRLDYTAITVTDDNLQRQGAR